ncbi:MAG: hypothetical protein DCF18_07035 [Cyanobium sp.]|nr:MAG: hypothetical protein DCF18_07035 [Cyanobium sp.]
MVQTSWTVETHPVIGKVIVIVIAKAIKYLDTEFLDREMEYFAVFSGFVRFVVGQITSNNENLATVRATIQDTGCAQAGFSG